MQFKNDGENPFDVRIFGPDEIRLFRVHPGDALVRMTLADDRSWIDVRIARAFPFSKPESYVGLRDGKDKDIGLIYDPAELDAVSQEAVREELSVRYFTPTISRVLSVKEEMGTINWDVETDRGRRRFVVRSMRDNTFPLGPNRLMMTDVDGNRYEFSDVTAVGQRAYAVLAKVL